MTGENLTAFAVVPATFRLNENMRINFNGGWLWDRSVDRHYLLYGIGFDWKFTETLQWTIEAFGQAGQSDTPSVVRPRFQTGVRYRPERDFLGRPDLRPQHHGRKRQLDHARHHDPFPGAGRQA